MKKHMLTTLAISGLVLATACSTSHGTSPATSAATTTSTPATPTLTPMAKAAVSAAKTADYSKPGFFVKEEKGRLWVFKEGSKELEEFKQHGEPAKQVVRPGAGPGGITLKGPDSETIQLYILSKNGFHVQEEKGRFWVFKLGTKELEEFKQHGEPAKQVVRPGAGPGGITLKGPDSETITAYLSAP